MTHHRMQKDTAEWREVIPESLVNQTHPNILPSTSIVVIIIHLIIINEWEEWKCEHMVLIG